MARKIHIRKFAAVVRMKKDIKSIHLFEGWSFGTINYIFFALGLTLIILGYLVMAMGEVNSFQSLTVAPILLFSGYVVVIPMALIYKKKT